MCVGMAAKVVGVKNGMAVIDASGARREVYAELIENLEPGEFVMVHAGTAIARITGDDQSETDNILEML
jgi:hydrogenase expression/formation protein HypC